MEIINPAKSLYSARNLAVVSAVVLIVFFLSSFAPKETIFFSCPSGSPPKLMEGVRVERDDLDVALEKAAMTAELNKTVVITVVNKAYVDWGVGDVPVNMLDVFLESFWLGEGTRPLINNLLIVAADRTAYERCMFRGLHCYLLADETDGSDLEGEKVFMSKGFIKMMWRRTLFLLTVLRKGYSFIFTDTDIVWLRNPFTQLNTSVAEDIAFSTDWFKGNPRSERNHFNTGFYFVRSNNKTISLFERWYTMKDNSTGMKEQDVLRNLVRRGILNKLNITASFLQTRYFSGFCQDSKEFDKVVTVHANCCRYVRAKVKDLTRVLEDWKRFRVASTDQNSSFAWSEHRDCLMSWKKRNITS